MKRAPGTTVPSDSMTPDELETYLLANIPPATDDERAAALEYHRDVLRLLGLEALIDAA